MPTFAANLHYLFNEVPFLERFAHAAASGFRAVEFQVPYDFPAQQLADLLTRHELALALIDTPTGNWQASERGLASVPGREQEFLEGLEKTLSYAQVLKPDCVHGRHRDRTHQQQDGRSVIADLSAASIGRERTPKSD